MRCPGSDKKRPWEKWGEEKTLGANPFTRLAFWTTRVPIPGQAGRQAVESRDDELDGWPTGSAADPSLSSEALRA